MKKFLLNILFLVYTFSSMLVLLSAIGFIFAVGDGGLPSWTGWFIFPLALIAMASQKPVFEYFIRKDVL